MPNLGDQLLHFLNAYQQGKDEILREVFSWLQNGKLDESFIFQLRCAEILNNSIAR